MKTAAASLAAGAAGCLKSEECGERAVLASGNDIYFPTGENGDEFYGVTDLEVYNENGSEHASFRINATFSDVSALYEGVKKGDTVGYGDFSLKVEELSERNEMGIMKFDYSENCEL